MKLEDIGYLRYTEKVPDHQHNDDFELGRIIAEHKERYLIATENGELEAEITGNMRFTAESREDFPAVGDWVNYISYDKDFAIINKILPRYSLIRRQSVGSYGEVQIIGTNIDYAFIMQSVNRDFNINRLERYLTICYAEKIKPIIVLTKTDLIDKQQLQLITDKIEARIQNIQVLAISNETKSGFEELTNNLKTGLTYCMLGSSGVGKSTLLNNLLEEKVMKTDNISESTNKGKHVSTHRELKVLKDGGILIDNPGMREVGIVDETGGLEDTFDKIMELSESCRFSDCKHINETGCAVIEAVESGDLEENYYKNYLKLEKEKSHFETTVQEKRKREKEFGKLMKNYKKDRKNNY